METFLLKLAVAVTPLIFLVAFVTLASTASLSKSGAPWPGIAGTVMSCAPWLMGRCCAEVHTPT